MQVALGGVSERLADCLIKSLHIAHNRIKVYLHQFTPSFATVVPISTTKTMDNQQIPGSERLVVGVIGAGAWGTALVSDVCECIMLRALLPAFGIQGGAVGVQRQPLGMCLVPSLLRMAWPIFWLYVANSMCACCWTVGLWIPSGFVA